MSSHMVNDGSFFFDKNTINNFGPTLFTTGKWYTEEQAWQRINELINLPTPSYYVIKLKGQNLFLNNGYLSLVPLLFGERQEAESIMSEFETYDIKVRVKDSEDQHSYSELEIHHIELRSA